MNAAFPTVHGTYGPLAVIDTLFGGLACITGLEPYLWKEWPVIAAQDINTKRVISHRDRGRATTALSNSPWS